MNRNETGSQVISLTAWWAMVTVIIWVISLIADQPASLAECAGSAALLTGLGEIGDWLRRRWSAARSARGRREP